MLESYTFEQEASLVISLVGKNTQRRSLTLVETAETRAGGSRRRPWLVSRQLGSRAGRVTLLLSLGFLSSGGSDVGSFAPND